MVVEDAVVASEYVVVGAVFSFFGQAQVLSVVVLLAGIPLMLLLLALLLVDKLVSLVEVRGVQLLAPLKPHPRGCQLPYFP